MLGIYKLEISSKNKNTNDKNELLVLTSSEKIAYDVNFKDSPYKSNRNVNKIAFGYTYGQNGKIDSHLDDLRQNYVD